MILKNPKYVILLLNNGFSGVFSMNQARDYHLSH